MPHPFKKMIDYITLFTDVNKKLIDSDIDQNKRGKIKTNRYPITPLFVEAT